MTSDIARGNSSPVDSPAADGPEPNESDRANDDVTNASEPADTSGPNGAVGGEKSAHGEGGERGGDGELTAGEPADSERRAAERGRGERDAPDVGVEAAELSDDKGDLDPDAVRQRAAEQAPEERVRTSRVGRDLPAAIGVGLGLGIMLILSLVFLPVLFVVVASIGIGIATLEVNRRLRQAQVIVPWVPVLVGGQAIMWMTWAFGAIGGFGAFGATVVVTLLWRLLAEGFENPPQNYLRDVSIAIFVLAWIPLMASFAVLMVTQPMGSERVLCFLIAAVCSDVGGYVSGVLFGKHPMAPAISPKKSWEGLAGSLVLCTIGSVLTVTLILNVHSFIGIALGAVVALSATFGDLIESQVKRDLGIKDMGTMLPGHGGIMDRLDSILPSAFVSWLVLAALV